MDASHILLLITAATAGWWLHRRGMHRLDAMRREYENKSAYASTILDTISDGVAACDAHGRLTFFNSAAKHWHGLPPLEIPIEEMARSYDLFRSDGVTPLPPEENPLLRAFRGETVHNQELMVCPPGLPRRRIQAAGAPLHGVNLKKLGAVATLRDVTSQVQAEQEARAALAIIESSSSILFKWRVADGWPVEYVSENVNQFGYQGRDFTEGRIAYTSIIHPEDLAQVNNEVTERLASGAIHFYQHYRILDAQGRIRWIDDWTQVIRDDYGRVTHLHGIMTDATDREVIAGMLRESEQRMELALSGAELGMWDWDIAGGRMVANERWADMLGYSLSDLDLSFDAWMAMVHPDERASVRADLETHLSGGEQLYQAEYRLQRRDGDWAWIHVRGKVLARDEAGRPLRMAGTHQDVTLRREAELERSELEEQMRRTQKLESLGVLAGGIAHDFNNILMAVLGNVELARLEMPDEAPATEFLQEIEQAAEQAADLCNQMLAYSGKGRIRMQEVDLSCTVREITQMIGVSVSKKIALRFDLADNLPTFRADVSQIRQVIMNLITNASEAIGDQPGEILIRTALQEHGHGQDSRCLSIEVSDTGCGMDEETRSRLFEPFFTTKFTGRGLGMAAVGGIVKAHGGEIEIESTLGQGTRIRVTLPGIDAEGAAVAPTTAGANTTAADSTRVLLVDDEESVLRMGTRLLESLGHRVITAVDGRDAVEIVEADPDIGCVLMDLTMPRMDGAEALIAMKQLRPELPVIISSGYHAEGIAERLEMETPFIQKPYRRDELADTLAAAITRTAPLPVA